MKHFTLTSRTLLGLALMGAFCAAPTLTSRAQAQTTPELQTRLIDANDRINDDTTDNDNDGPRYRHDRDGHDSSNRDGSRGDQDGRGPGARNGNRGGDRNGRELGGRNGKRDEFGGRNAKGDDAGARNRGGRDFGGRNGKGGEFGGHDNAGRDSGGRENMGRNFGGRDGKGRDFDARDNAGGNRPGRAGNVAPVVAPKFVGVVTKVKSDREFDVRIDNKTYNVYLSAPSAIVRVGQTVGLDGERIGTNDIRSASLLQPRRR